MELKVLYSGFLLCLLVKLSCAGSCDYDAIKNCLIPVKQHLDDNNMGNPTKGLFQIAIEHYLLTLRDQHDYFIHITSLNTIMKKIDEVFMHPDKVDEGCRIFTAAEKCLKNIEVWCHQEVRDQLTGIENTFNYMCQNKYKSTYLSHYKCLIRKELDDVRKTCDDNFEKALNSIAQPPLDGNNTQISGSVKQGESETLKYDLHKGGINMNVNLEQRDEKQYLKTKVCSVVSEALQCYKGEVDALCNSTASEWSYQLRHSLVQLLLIDLQCESGESYFSVHSLLNETGCFACLDGSICIDKSRKCDSTADCPDGSDEDNCGSGFQIASILIAVTVVAVVAILVIVCVVKCREEIAYGLKRSNSSTEIMSITQQEMRLGDSTPPVSSGKFIYKPVPGKAATANA